MDNSSGDLNIENSPLNLFPTPQTITPNDGGTRSNFPSMNGQQLQSQLDNLSPSEMVQKLLPSTLVQKRVVFVSLNQLHRSLMNPKGMPKFVFDHAICAFAIRRKWLFPESDEDRKEAEGTYAAYFLENNTKDKDKKFLEKIREKDKLRGYLLHTMCYVLPH